MFRIWAERGGENLVSLEETDFVSPVTPPSSASLPVPPASHAVEVETASAEKIDLNSAPLERIETLPGVGPKLAKGIIDYRERGGVFRTTEDLLQVRGFGPKRLHQLEPYLTFDSHDKR